MIIVVTGLSGSGKSTITQNYRFCKTIDLDKWVKRHLYRRWQKGYRLIKKEFGVDAINFWSVNREELTHLIKNDRNNLTRINDIVFPHVKKMLYRLREGKRACVVEQATYINHESDFRHLYDKVILITRRDSIRKRKNDFLKNEKIKYDHLIKNNKTIAEAIKNYKKIVTKITEK